MPLNGATVAKDQLFRFPTVDADENYIIGFRDRYFQRYSQYRNRHLTRIALGLYYELGRQWIERDWEETFEGVRGFAFKEMNPTSEIELPKPVTNRIAPAVDGEGGFGFDPVFIPRDLDLAGEPTEIGVQGEVSTHGRTFAAVDMELKGNFSHRTRALKDLLTQLGPAE